MNIDALFMVKERTTEIRNVELIKPAAGEVQVKVVACGVCAWDAFLFQGKDLLQPFPFSFGHEAVGEIIAVGSDVNSFQPGDKVFCIDGGPSMAQIINIKSDFVGLLPGNPEKAADYVDKIGEPVVCVVNGLANITIPPGARVAIIGVGYMGLLNVQALRRSLISELVCFDIDQQKLDLASKYGADAVWLSNSSEGQNAIKDYIKNGGFDVVVECSGSQPGLTLATQITATGGTISNFAWHRENRVVDASPWHLRGLKIINTAPACDRHFSDHVVETQRLMAAGVFDQKNLITHVMDYHDIQKMLEIAQAKSDGYIKGVITFN